MIKVFSESAREVLVSKPNTLHLGRDNDGKFTWQIVEDGTILAEGRSTTMELREAEITKFETGDKVKPEQVDVSLMHYSSEKHQIEAGGNSAAQFLARLPSMNSRALLKVLEGVTIAERAAFVFRGAAVHELVKRKLKEVERVTKVKGQGVDTICNTLAKEVGIDGKTLYKDWKVFELFGARLLETVVDMPERLLPREFYTIAVGADVDMTPPVEVLDYFEEQREVTGGYFTDHARRDIKRVNDGMTLDEIRDLDGTERMERVREKRSLPGEKMTSLQIPATAETSWYVNKIIERHASFSSWFHTRCREEFGTAVRVKK